MPRTTDLVAATALAVGLSARTEQRRVAATAKLGHKQSELGQFFTPELAAALIAGLPALPRRGRLRVLDPGAGVGTLTAALVARVLLEGAQLDLELVCVEVDERVAESLKQTLDDITQTMAEAGLTATTQVISGDYIELSTSMFNRSTSLDEPFDLVVMNPPYRKLATASPHRKALANVGVDAPNLYAAFLALGTNALRSGGQVVAITPRSFANGSYFAQFRRYLLERVALNHLHVFESRSTVFADTGVLQENIVLSATRDGRRNDVILSVSRGHQDAPDARVVSYESVVEPDDGDQFIRVPTSDEDETAVGQMAALPATLRDLGLSVSTGKVVDFRAANRLTRADVADSVPLVYPGNLRAGRVEWPRNIGKSQGLIVGSDGLSDKLVLPAGNYVLVKRFSSKEERRRIVAAVWKSDQSDGPVAFENHLNVFHIGQHGMDLDLATGLSYWLNTTLVDDYFRTFSGHTQVNAGDLKTLRFPTVDQLRSFGRERALELPDQESIDRATAHLVCQGGLAA